jgi:hypothetical protein
MTLTITGTTMTSDQNQHTARPAQDQVTPLISPARARASSPAAASPNRKPRIGDLMTDSPEQEDEADLDDGRPDPSDPRIAWKFSTRELTPEEYAEFSNYNRRDFAWVQAAREADARYAAWKAANPAAAAEQEAAFEAASRAAYPLLYGLAPEAGPQATADGPDCPEPQLNASLDRAASQPAEPDPEAEIG